MIPRHRGQGADFCLAAISWFVLVDDRTTIQSPGARVETHSRTGCGDYNPL